MPKAKTADTQLKELRDALNIAVKGITLDRFIEIYAAAGFKLHVAKRTLSAFLNDDPTVCLKQDSPHLRMFLASQIGQILLGESSPEASPTELIPRLTKRIHSSTLRQGDRDLRGIYFAYHGAQIVKNHYVVRVIRIFHNKRGEMCYSAHFNDKVTGLGDDQMTEGVVIFSQSLPHFLTLHKDNAVGLLLIIGERIFPKDGKPVNRIFARMFGMNYRTEHFTRSLMFERIPGATLVSHYMDQTGVRPFDEWSAEVQSKFYELKRYSHELSPDPVMSLVPNTAP